MALSRNSTLDIARGLGIVLVVLGHNWFALHESKTLFRAIFAFHMPLFFFLSGMFLSRRDPVARTVARKADSLLKPYVVVMACVVGWALWRQAAVQPLAADAVRAAVGSALFAHGGAIQWPWTPMWFLPCLFVTVCATFAVVKATDSVVLHTLCVALALAVGIPAFKDSGLPWSADLLPLSFAFCLLGYLLRGPVAAMAWRPLEAVLAALAFLAVNRWVANRFDMNARQFGDLAVALLQAGLGIYLVLSAACLFARLTGQWSVAGRALSAIGARALFVLMFHIAFQDRAFDAGMALFGRPEAAALCALAGGVGLPLLAWEVVRRSRVLSVLLLPLRRRAVAPVASVPVGAMGADGPVASGGASGALGVDGRAPPQPIAPPHPATPAAVQGGSAK